MKKFIVKHGNVFAALALMITTINVNSTCWFIMHQDKLPKAAKKLRKF